MAWLRKIFSYVLIWVAVFWPHADAAARNTPGRGFDPVQMAAMDAIAAAYWGHYGATLMTPTVSTLNENAYFYRGDGTPSVQFDLALSDPDTDKQLLAQLPSFPQGTVKIKLSAEYVPNAYEPGATGASPLTKIRAERTTSYANDPTYLGPLMPHFIVSRLPRRYRRHVNGGYAVLAHDRLPLGTAIQLNLGQIGQFKLLVTGHKSDVPWEEIELHHWQQQPYQSSTFGEREEYQQEADHLQINLDLDAGEHGGVADGDNSPTPSGHALPITWIDGMDRPKMPRAQSRHITPPAHPTLPKIWNRRVLLKR